MTKKELQKKLISDDIKPLNIYCNEEVSIAIKNMCLNNGKKLIFLGDETCNPILYDRLKEADYVMHEAFCLDKEEQIFKAYEKHHSTVKSACESMQSLNIKNLILFHTEDTHKDKKELYTVEAREYFDGNVIVPNDLDEIEL